VVAKWKLRKVTADLSDLPPVKKIAIVGLPNTGKSQVFNNLTGEYTLVSNYPLTTVEMKRTKCRIDGDLCEVIDTPGLHCLYIHSEEELVVREMILSEKPDVVVQCIDANQLKQSLTLTADLLELGLPMVISLNAIDETARRGMWIDSGSLSRRLGVPVVESIAVKGLGVKELREAIARARPARPGVRYGRIVEDGIARIESQLPQDNGFGRKLAVLLLLDDPFLTRYLQQEHGEEKVASLRDEANRLKESFRGSFAVAIHRRRSEWIEDLADEATRRQRLVPGEFSKAFGRLSRHPVFGVLMLILVIALMFLLVVNVANVIARWMDEALWAPIEGRIDSLAPSRFWKDFLIGDYGILSLGLANAFLTILPILTVFFLAFNILEDVGYIPNLCVLTNRILDKLGLSGRAIMPLVLGFGCKTMATLTAKTLRSRKERYIAIYLIAFAIPCAAQMALNMSILGRMGVGAFMIAFGVLGVVEVLAGVTLNKVLREEQRSDFLQELPPIRLPNPKAVIVKTYHRVCWFIKEAVPVFIYAAVVLFAIDKLGILDAAKSVLEPVMQGLLGLPVQMVDALILCMARHEAAAGLIIKLIQKGQLNYVQCIVSVTITTMFVPCFANVMAMIKELGVRRALGMAVIINVSSFGIAGILNLILTAFYGR